MMEHLLTVITATREFHCANGPVLMLRRFQPWADTVCVLLMLAAPGRITC